MSSIAEFLTRTVPEIALPIIVATTFALFKLLESHSINKATIEMVSREPAAENRPSATENIKALIAREDVSLRVLEEVFQATASKFFFLSQDSEARRVIALGKIQNILRNVMSDAVKSDDFPIVRDRAIKLIDEAHREMEILQQRKPFDGMQEPERSLLVDLLAEIPTDKQIPRQKALQLADIIRIKHQNILKLQQDNAKSAAWTRWGTYGTVLFGVLSIVLSIYTTIK